MGLVVSRKPYAIEQNPRLAGVVINERTVVVLDAFDVKTGVAVVFVGRQGRTPQYKVITETQWIQVEKGRICVSYGREATANQVGLHFSHDRSISIIRCCAKVDDKFIVPLSLIKESF